MANGIVNSYRLLWVGMILLFGGAIWWFSLGSPDARSQADRFDPSQIKRLPEDKPAEEEVKDLAESFEDTAPKDILVDNADFTITGPDGMTQMTIWVEQGTRDGGDFKLVKGTLKLQMENHSSLLLKVTDGLFSSEDGRVRVEGSITGQIYGKQQFFEARKLVWQQDTNIVQTDTVRYIGPFVDVTADSMEFDVQSGEVSFEGPVTAGI